ncbi:GNAT family N-acetyltransferase [Streptomyces sp. NPDC056835]|uniref:GNAT family N-acetyltransferase n=1 Tax=Streptomyces sp. NPDC056835 TaxID=3345956 RepID=UPI0036CD40E4
MRQQWSAWVVEGLARHMPRHRIADYFAVKDALLGGAGHRHAIADEDGDCVGLATASLRDYDHGEFLYIETLLVSERHHGTVLTRQLIAELFGGVVKDLGDFPDLVAMKTYNARTYVLMRAFADPESKALFYPRIDGTPSGPAAEATARAVAEALGSGRDFDPGSGVVTGGGGEVPPDFWPDFPASRDHWVNTYFQRELTAHDRLLCFIDSSRPEAKAAIRARLGI